MKAWLLRGLLVLLLLPVVFYALVWRQTERMAAAVYRVADPALVLPTDSHALAQGAHLYETRGCADCHGADGSGREVFDAGPVARVVGPNLTPAQLAARGYDADGIAAAIRHGVRPDGRPLFFMPVVDWQHLGDEDTAALVAYLASLPDSPHDPGRSELRPLGRVLTLLGKFDGYPAAGIDHSPRQRATPEVRANAEYGAYVAQTCSSCHGADFSGGLVMEPGKPPTSNLTPSGLAGWTEADFFRAMREGKRPDGSDLDPLMPWQAFSKMTRTELRAMWIFFQQLPPA